MYCVGFYTIPYVWVHIWSWHTWTAGKKTTSCTRVYVQDWRWVGYIFYSNPCNLISVTDSSRGILIYSRYPTEPRWWLIHIGMSLWYVVRLCRAHGNNLYGHWRKYIRIRWIHRSNEIIYLNLYMWIHHLMNSCGIHMGFWFLPWACQLSFLG